MQGNYHNSDLALFNILSFFVQKVDRILLKPVTYCTSEFSMQGSQLNW